jgi:hypothetical protein
MQFALNGSISFFQAVLSYLRERLAFCTLSSSFAAALLMPRLWRSWTLHKLHNKEEHKRNQTL